jgi:hypothetical protein
MGLLYYGAEAQPIEMPDRILAHVKVVATTKLRRNESFTMTWKHPDGGPAGRTSVWMQPAIPLRFVFASAEPETLDPDYLRTLANAAAGSGGMMIEWASEQELREPIDIRSQVAVAA